MKAEIHPKYYKTKAECACGAIFDINSTKESIKVEICSECHPFYTGKEKLIDAAGRVEKFRARLEAAKQAKAAKNAGHSVKKKH
ncbi:50S ribosomal protein L31 [Candidatus Giovannonibacteria bacterium]|nr:50S ribosomal protein L31 [Candidatus Giovannonibacteria bacterium]